MINARILVRKGLRADFDPTKMLPGEWAVSIDASTSNQIVWMCFAPGVCKRMGTYEDFQNMIYNSTGQIIERYEDAFNGILDEVKVDADAVSANTDIVLIAKSDIIDMYLPQIESYANDASVSASEAKTYSEFAEQSAIEASESAEEAKKYSEKAFAATPEGYEALVDKVDVLDNAIAQTTDRTLYGSKEGGIKLIGINGASEQAQYSGAQLFNYDAWKDCFVYRGTAIFENNGITLTATENDSYTDYTATTVPEDAFIKVSEGDIITMSWESDATATKNGRVYIFGTGSATNASAEATAGKVTYTVPSGVTKIIFRVGVITAGNTISYKNIMINKGDTALPYEPYVGGTASPNPFYPQEIKSVGDSGSLTIKTEGKQVLDILKNTTKTYGGVTVSTDDKGMVSVSGTATSSGGLNTLVFSDECTLKKGTYYLSRQIISGNASKFYTCFTPNGSSTGITFSAGKPTTINEDVTGYWGFNLILDTTYDLSLYLTITRELEYTDYIPYVKSSIITIPLSEPLRGIGEVKDEIVCQDGVWGVLRRIGSIILNGSEEWTLGAYPPENAMQFYTARASGMVKGCTLLTDHFRYTGGSYKNGCWVGDWLNFYPSTDLGIADIEAFSAWIKENPVTVQYTLDIPTFEPFADQTPFYGLESFDTVTYIGTDSEIEPSIELKFAKTEVGALALENYNLRNLLELSTAKEVGLLKTNVETTGILGGYANSATSWLKTSRNGNVVTVSYSVEMARDRTAETGITIGLPIQELGTDFPIYDIAIRSSDGVIFTTTLEGGSIIVHASTTKPLAVGDVITGSFTYVATD